MRSSSGEGRERRDDGMSMDLKKLPLKHPKPNMETFMKAIVEGVEPPRPPLVEYLVDPRVMKPILTDVIGREWAEGGLEYWDNFVALWFHLGYDFVRLESGLPFPSPARPGKDPGTGFDRHWAETHEGPIQSWSDFESYPWPKVEDACFELYRYVAIRLPEGMGLLSCHGGGIFEHVSRLMGYETLCLMLHDDPRLVQSVTDRVGALILEYHSGLLEIPSVRAIFQGDDMGFKTATLISPQHLREVFLPWHARFAQNAHSKGRAYFLHSCGCLEEIMPDLIDTVGIDAKHSFEDAIVPVTEMKRRYGTRIGILGGIDVDVLTRKSPDEVRAHVRQVVTSCAPGGRYAVGSGNSIPSYIPVENYLAMVDEALAWS